MTAINEGRGTYPGPIINPDSTGMLWRSARYIKRNILYDLLLYPYGQKRHRQLTAEAERNNHHTHTSFYRSPGQLEALVGPVVQYLLQGRNPGKLIINIFAGSSGAEAYTMASVLVHAFPGLDFHINCSDLHSDKVEEAKLARFSLQQITQGLPIPLLFLEKTFDRTGDCYTVKPGLSKHVSFSCSDIISGKLSEEYELADIVCAQNVFCHMSNEMTTTAFYNVISTAKERSAVFIDGMNPDLRARLTTEVGLQPLEFKHKEIYQHARLHLSPAWWRYYYGREPYLFFKSDKLRRYSTIFLRG
ncbi:CheR family methyltransferase [Haliea sp. E17]|uniref:CheR family methyltransferase n=1 Tax=Haliea sp. E17 TaxID=3401576 RepID=UPI003AB0FC99